MSGVLLITFIVLLLLDVPVVYCMLVASLAALWYAGVDPIMVGLEPSRAMASFYPFLAVPFFILAGDLMNRGGLSEKITELAKALVGHRRGGLAMVTTVSAQMFGAISGASSATCAAIGRVMIPAMEKQGYPRPFSAALTACSGTTGALIPPSIALLISAAGLFSWVLSYGHLPQAMAEGLLTGCQDVVGLLDGHLEPETLAAVNKVLVLLVLNVALLLVGMFVDAGPALLIVVPVLLPVSREIGMDPVHFGTMVVSNLVIGLVTPPVGTTLFVAGGIGHVQISEMIPHVMRFFFVMVAVQLLVTFVPAITLFLPSFLG